jgi:hypothetical protein
MGKNIFGLVLATGLAAMAQVQVPSATPSEPAQLLSPEQLDNLVAPVALYPDQLLSQVLAASTYPLEIVEAQQWLQRNGNLPGTQLMDAAKQQNWDPSVQAMVAFPDAMALLTRDVQWTTALGNAFLAQQADVMNAIQEMRARAQNNGRLVNTPQQTVTTQAQDGQSAIAIQPANPQVMYVPSYNPDYVWGPPAAGYYPQLGYPSNSVGVWFGRAINIASYFAGFASLLGGFGGWGWVLNWLTHSLFLNGLFFNLFGFHGGAGYGGGYGGFGGGGYAARSVWVHDPGHRLGVPYPNRVLASRFGGGFHTANAGFASRGGFGAHETFGSHEAFASHGFATQGLMASRGSVGNGWHSASEGRSFEGRAPEGRAFAGEGRSFAGSSARSFGNSFGGSTSRGFAGNTGNFGSSRGWTSPGGSSFLSPGRSSERSGGTQQFAQARSSERFSAPRESAQHFSEPRGSSHGFKESGGSHFSSGHGSGGHGGGHGSGGHSHGGGGHHK